VMKGVLLRTSGGEGELVSRTPGEVKSNAFDVNWKEYARHLSRHHVRRISVVAGGSNRCGKERLSRCALKLGSKIS
jgi:hypothetical protein